MRFAIVANKCLPFHAYSLNERPLGGTETAIIRLAEALQQRGHEVAVFTADENPPPSQPRYLRLSAFHSGPEADVLISVRDWLPLCLPFRSRKRFYWTGDSYDQVQNYGIGDRRFINAVDGFLAVSAWQAATLCARSGFPLEKAWVLRNGVHLPYFEGHEERERKRLIYSSMPYRGLKLVPDLYRDLREKHPDAQLHVFSGYSVYGGENMPSESAQKEARELLDDLRTLPDCFVQGNILQKDLAREFMKSSILFYPNIFEETSCITALEAQAGGCCIVTSDLGALRDTVGDAGYLVKGKPGSPEYRAAFLEAADKVLSDDALFAELSQRGLKRARELFDWNVIAARLEEYLCKVHGL